MVKLETLHNVEISYDMDSGGETGSPLLYFVKGGHYTDSFLLAVVRMFRDEDGARLESPIRALAPLVHHSWWVEVPYLDDDGVDKGSWEYQACRADTPGAYPVTYMDISEARDHFVDLCRACDEGHHQECSMQLTGMTILYDHQAGVGRHDFPLRQRRWTYDSRRF